MSRTCAVLSVVVMVLLHKQGVQGLGEARAMQEYEAMQLLQRLGLDNGGPHVPEVRVGEKKHPQDSPIFYIKLPPLPYFYAQNNLHQFQGPTTTPYPFQKVSVDFTNNGRPDQIYHWTQSDSYNSWTKPSTTTTTTTPRTTTTTTTTPAPPPILKEPIKKPYFPSRPSSVVADHPWFPNVPSPPPVPSILTPSHPWLPSQPVANPASVPPGSSKPWFPSKPSYTVPWYLSNNLFSANGKPSSIYIYKPKQPINPAKYKSKKPKHAMFTHFNY
ncbi:unnamed protein product [Meganyctiphanes norvegica]|uniref:Uncharacterized protein n=1 Tax=Meganyctiphanes norvegica TaxID=48144 RepID=A0AAV2QNA4_MEGNR